MEKQEKNCWQKKKIESSTIDKVVATTKTVATATAVTTTAATAATATVTNRF